MCFPHCAGRPSVTQRLYARREELSGSRRFCSFFCRLRVCLCVYLSEKVNVSQQRRHQAERALKRSTNRLFKHGGSTELHRRLFFSSLSLLHPISIHPSSPPSWRSLGSLPKPVTCLRPTLRGTTLRADGIPRPPQTAAAAMNTKARLVLSLFTPPTSDLLLLRLPALTPPHSLLVHSLSESTLLPSHVSLLFILCCLTDSRSSEEGINK